MSYSVFVQYNNYYVDYQGLQKAGAQYPVLNKISSFSSALSSKQFNFLSICNSSTTVMSYQQTINHFQKIAETAQNLENKLNKIRFKYSINSEQFIYKIVKNYTNILKPKPFSIFKRTYPSINKTSDAIHCDWLYRELLSPNEQKLLATYLSSCPDCEYGNRLLSKNMSEIGLSYKDQQIVKVHPLITSSDNQIPLYKGMTETGKHVFQQKGLKSGFVACVYMLLSDHSEHYLSNPPSDTYLNMTNCESMMRFLKEEIAQHTNTDLRAIKTQIRSFEEFKEKLEMHGSACIKVESDATHIIIVDRINKENTEIDIRDPFHGWAITITAEAFLNTSRILHLPLDLIQVIKNGISA